MAIHGWSQQLKKLRTKLKLNEKSIFDSDNVQLVKQMREGSTKNMLVYNTYSEES